MFSQYENYNRARNFQRSRYPNRRSLTSEIQRTWLISVIGLALLFSSLICLLWNERQTVQLSRSLDEGFQKLVIPETNDVVFEENNGKLVFLADQIQIPDSLTDSTYGISINAVKLKKVVQMYQWYEIEDRLETSNGVQDSEHDGHVDLTYSYDMNWFDHLIDSNAFSSPMGHHNPERWPVNSSVVINSRVKVGNFLLGSETKDKFSDFNAFTSDERPSNHEIKMHAGLYFHAKDVWRPDIGDIRIQFLYAGKHGDQVTVIGKQTGREIRPFQTESGDEILLVHQGLRTAEEIFRQEKAQNRFKSFVCRMLGWFLSFLGFTCWESLLDIIVSEIPEVRRILSLGYTSLPFSFSVSYSLLISGMGWIWYRPFLGLILVSFAIIPSLISLGRWWQIRRSIQRHHLS